MIRILIIMFAVAFFVLTIRSLLSKPAKKQSSKPNTNSEPVVACSMCQLHVPRSEALKNEDNFFCSENHQHEWLNKQKQ